MDDVYKGKAVVAVLHLLTKKGDLLFSVRGVQVC